MKKKRNITIVGLFFIVNLAWVSCVQLGSHSKADSFEEGVLRVWATWGDEADQLQIFFDRYSQTTGQPVRVTTGLDSDEILEALGSPTPPDVVILSSSDLVGMYNEQGLIEALDPWAEAEDIDLEDIYPVALSQCEMQDGRILCLPWGSDIPVLFWNKDLFAAAGLDPERPPQTMEELVEYAEKLTLRDEKGKLSQVGFIPDFPRSHTDLYARMFGGYWYSDDGAEWMVASQAMVDAANWQRQFYASYGEEDIRQFILSINPYINSSHPVFAGQRLNCQQCHRSMPRKSKKIPDHGFYNGKVAMMVDSQWQLGQDYISRFQPELNYGVAPFPAPASHPERANTTVVQGPVVIIPASALDKEAAVRLLAWMMSPEILADAAYTYSSLPSSRTAAQDLRFQQISHFEVFIDLLAHPNAASRTSMPIRPVLNHALAVFEKDLLYKGGDPALLLEAIQAEFAPGLAGMLAE